MKTVLHVVGFILCICGTQLLAQNPFYGPPQIFPVQAPGRDFRTVDVDGDGNLDVVVLSELGIEILFGDGTGQLVLPVRLPTLRSVLLEFTIGDFNGDGEQDFVTLGRTFTSPRGFLDIYLSAGDRQWTAPSLAIGLNSFNKTEVAALDSNGDGFSDLAVVRGASLRSYVNRGNATFKAQPALGATADEIRVMDFNQDAISDLIVLTKGRARAFFGRGNGRFRKGPTLNARASDKVVIADLNNDGFLDVASLRKSRSGLDSQILVTLARSAERFFPERVVLESALLRSFDVTDYSRDGRLDLVALEENFLPTHRAIHGFRNLGDGLQYLFDTGVTMEPLFTRLSSFYVRDVNFDSVDDLLIVESSSSLMTVFLGLATGGFDGEQISVALGSRLLDEDKILWADLNGDTGDDMVIKGRGVDSNIHVFLSVGPPPG